MMLAIEKTDGKTVFLPPNVALIMWRAFRAALWARGIKRDPRQGDEMDGVRIVALTL